MNPLPASSLRRDLVRSNLAYPLQFIDDAHGLHADRADAPQQVDDPLLVVGKAVRVELLPDGGVPGLFLLVLVQCPF